MAKKDATKAKDKMAEGLLVVARNRRARFEFELIEKVEAGIVLTGTEVKSLRTGKASLEEAYASVERGEVWLNGCDIPEYLQANRMNHKPKRPRKLLLHRKEIDKVEATHRRAGIDPGPAANLLQEGDRQGRDLPGPGQEAARQARVDQEAGREARDRRAVRRG